MTDNVSENGEVKEQVATEGASVQATVQRMRSVYGAILSMAWEAAKARSAALIACMISLGLAGAVRGLVSKYVIDGLPGGAGPANALGWGIVFIVIVAIGIVIQDMLGLLQFDMGDRITQVVDQRIMSIVAGAPGLDHLERKEFSDKIKLVREQSYIPFSALANLNALSYLVFGLAAALILLGSIHPLLLLTPVAAIPASILQFKVLRKHYEKFDETAPEDRLAFHYMELITEAQSAKEVRLFGLGRALVKRHKKLTDAYIKKLFNDRLGKSAIGVVAGALYGLSIGGAIAFIGYLALNDRASIGEVFMGVMIAQMVIGHVEMAAGMFAWLAELSVVGERYLWMLNYVSSVVIREDTYPAPDAITKGIRFENVSFTYPGTKEPVLDNVSFSIAPGTTVALVGENGAGKTTLVKLLCRFYDPVDGRIFVDDVDLKDIDLDEWRHSLGAAFQDFVRPELLAMEAVGMGELPEIENREMVTAAAGFAGAERVIERLPNGFDSQLGRRFEEGTDLSEGEWQRVALARGAMRQAPALVVLDEPTASLDAKAEHEVFEAFARWTEGRGVGNPVTLLVSHRFSTVRMADLIVVLHEGKVEDIGTHDELVSHNGRYAELFSLQASRYD